jgi:hypothetical protein
MEDSIKGKSFFELTKEERKFVMDTNPPTISGLYEGNAYFGWNWTGCGFGQMTLRLDKGAMKIIVDSENMGRESVRKLLHSLADYIADRAIIVDYPNDIPPINLAEEVKLQEKIFQEKLDAPRRPSTKEVVELAVMYMKLEDSITSANASTSAIPPEQGSGRALRNLRNKTIVRIKYSHSQLDALTDSQIYNQPYGIELGEEKYILTEVKKLGYNKVINSTLDDVAFEHIVEVE